MDNYTKEQRNAYMRAYYNLHKNDPEYKAKRRQYYVMQKDKPEYKAKRNASNKKWYEAHKSDPTFRARSAENARRWRLAHPEMVESYRRKAILQEIHKEKGHDKD